MHQKAAPNVDSLGAQGDWFSECSDFKSIMDMSQGKLFHRGYKASESGHDPLQSPQGSDQSWAAGTQPRCPIGGRDLNP